MEKFMFKKDNNTDWTSARNEPNTASHSFHQDWIIIEGEKVINYRIVTCPMCQHAQKVDERKFFRDVLQIRCPWCNQTFSWDSSIQIGAQYYIEEVKD